MEKNRQPAAKKARQRLSAPIRRAGKLVLLCLALLLLIPSDGYLGEARTAFLAERAIGDHGFRLAAWEMHAVEQKLGDLVARPGARLSAQAQHDLVLAYFDAIGRIGDLNSRIRTIYADPKQTDPAAAAAPIQAELDAVRETQGGRRAAVERILENQVATILNENGLTTAGQVLPPVRFAFTESPDVLVISPRDRITTLESIHLDPALSAAQMEQIESRAATDLNVSALVEDTGGMSTYPTMVVEYPSLAWTLDTVAHEWTHTYLFFRPLGLHYEDSGGMRTINETVASLVGEEVSLLAMQRFYPERVAPSDWPRPLSMRADWTGRTAEPPAFDYGAFMRKTRLEVDQLLAEGRITEAETYMEAQRRILVAQGYIIRKLNQAYFAFHGSYAIGATATDPIGGKLRALRERVPDLLSFVRTVAAFNDPGDLDAALENGSAAQDTTRLQTR